MKKQNTKRPLVPPTPPGYIQPRDNPSEYDPARDAEETLHRAKKLLWGWTGRNLGNPIYDLDDAIQDTMVDVLSKGLKTRAADAPDDNDSRLRSIIYNKRRSSDRQYRKSQDKLRKVTPSDQTAHPLETAILSEQREAVRNAVLTLGEGQRNALYEVYGAMEPDVCGSSDCKPNAAVQRRHRAKEELRAKLMFLHSE